jgi:hypothetical protein
VAPVTHIEVGAIGLGSAPGVIGVNEELPAAPSAFLATGRPNPFAGSTAIEVAVAGPSRIQLRIFDSAGRLVRTLLDRPLAAGTHTQHWDGHDDSGRMLPSGAYFSAVTVNGSSQAKRLVLLR